jgi:hypothetical protein
MGVAVFKQPLAWKVNLAAAGGFMPLTKGLLLPDAFINIKLL